MATDFDQEEPVEKGYTQTAAEKALDEKEYQHTAKRLNNIPPATAQRDLIDTIFTVVNRDLLVCKLFYFFFFGAFGSLFPLLAIYFKQLGLNASQTGVLMGFRPFIEFLGVPFWGGVADRWKRWKELLMFSLFSWIVLTLAIAFVQPPPHKCLHSNGTHTVLIAPYSHKFKRETSSMDGPPMPRIYFTPDDDAVIFDEQTPNWGSETQYTEDCTNRCRRGIGRSPHSLDHTKIANANESDVIGLVHSPYSTVVYKEDAVQEVFFILLLLIVVGEFFSSPAITFADTVTLTILGDDTENYGRQRMFGSLGWGLAMFFVGMALDHSTTFPQHPCGVQHVAEKNYTVCFAVFTVLMSCAFITALQFRFPFQNQGPLQLTQITIKVKDVIKEKLTGVKKIDRTKLVEEDDDDNAFFSAETEKQRELERQREKDAPIRQQEKDAPIQPKTPYQAVEGPVYSYQGPDGPRALKINPQKDKDMVTDALKAPGVGTAASYDYDYSGETFMFKWMTVLKMLATYKYISVMFIAWFMGFGIGIIFTFLFWHLQDLGGSPTLFGVASVINHVSELLAYFFCSKFIAAWGHIRVLYAGLLGNIGRFLYISWLKNPWWVLPFEFLQGLTHAAVWAACCSYISQAIPKTLRNSAQGILQGLHHGLGRGCGAVFGGILVYEFGSVITFRTYGITCIIVFVLYVGVNYFLEDRGYFSHSSDYTSKFGHQILEENLHLAPHGVPSGMARDLSSSKLEQENINTNYGAANFEGMNQLPVTQGGGSRGVSNGQYQGAEDWPTRGSYQQDVAGYDSLVMGQPPKMPTNVVQQQPANTFDQRYGP